ncbi:pilin glycosylation protein [Fusobacterium polymorphum]
MKKKILGNYQKENLREFSKKIGTNKFFIGFGNMKYRKKVFDYFINNGWEAVNIIHPDAVVSKNARLGKGILIECGCLITPNPVIGNNVVVNTGSQVNHDNIIEDNVYIASGVILSGGIKIGENTLLDDGVIITLGCSVGKNSLIGAGAVVTKNIPDKVVAYGSPCKVIRENN